MTTHITKTWFDGEKVVTQEIHESEIYKQEPVAWIHRKHYLLGHAENMPPADKALAQGWEPLYTTPPAAQPCPYIRSTAEGTHHCALSQRQPLTDEGIERACVPLGAAMLSFTEVARAIEAAHGIKGKNT